MFCMQNISKHVLPHLLKLSQLIIVNDGNKILIYIISNEEGTLIYNFKLQIVQIINGFKLKILLSTFVK